MIFSSWHDLEWIWRRKWPNDRLDMIQDIGSTESLRFMSWFKAKRRLLLFISSKFCTFRYDFAAYCHRTICQKILVLVINKNRWSGYPSGYPWLESKWFKVIENAERSRGGIQHRRIALLWSSKIIWRNKIN